MNEINDLFFDMLAMAIVMLVLIAAFFFIVFTAIRIPAYGIFLLGCAVLGWAINRVYKIWKHYIKS
jgi:hypothetical protein